MHSRRSGVTLTEVLVAIFVCGLGLMALMTLFPLGAANMAQAIDDDRCAHSAANASAILRSAWRVSLQTTGTNTYLTGQLEPALRNGPVYIDPIGHNIYGAAALPGGIPRMNLGTANYTDAVRWCTLLDEIDFAPTGLPLTPLSRQGRFSWAWMVRWLRDPGQARMRTLEYQVVVYRNRPTSQNSGAVPRGEYQYPANYIGNNVVEVPYAAGSKPAIRRGGWVLDATAGSPAFGYFFRVTRVGDDGAALTLTLQSDRRGGAGGGAAPHGCRWQSSGVRDAPQTAGGPTRTAPDPRRG
ncbi:MAG: prepilin-type N-terminal cleavage/methylation domain-containing protein, partial [Planctomycetia bacterium]|nr:prepilin-type N-terminal cleavage/methylation domain-containing protein [Planctomycetia bacterium]